MANGKIRFGKQSGGQLALVFPDGVANTEVVFPESGILAKTSDINTAGVELKTIATGTATFTATTNTVTFSGLSVDEIENFAQIEIGDVLQYSNATDAKNNSEFTVEVLTQEWEEGVVITAGLQRKSVTTNITYTALTSGTTSGTDVTDDIGVSWEIATSETIIVNQGHANKGTKKNVATRASDTGVTVKLLSKWYNAPLGLGQDWVDVTANMGGNVDYLNNTKRTIAAEFKGVGSTDANRVKIIVNGIWIESAVQGATTSTVYANIPIDAMYKYVGPNGTHAVKELR